MSPIEQMIENITPEQAVDVFRQMKAKHTASGEDHDIAARCIVVLREFIARAREAEARISQPATPQQAAD